MAKARKVEMDFFKKMNVYTKVLRKAGVKVMSARWVDTNKGDDVVKEYRARFLGRKINTSKRDDYSLPRHLWNP